MTLKKLFVKPIYGTLKKMMQKFHTSVLVIKLIAADALVREYLI